MSLWGCTCSGRVSRVKRVSQLKNSCARAGLRWVAAKVLSWPRALYEGVNVEADEGLSLSVHLLGCQKLRIWNWVLRKCSRREGFQ